MKRSLLAAGVLSLGLWNLEAQASDHGPQHFKGVPSETYEQAVANLAEYNPKLAAIVAKESLTPKDMADIHQLTYTLENAIERIKEHLEMTAETLEDVHQASEKAQYDIARDQGRIYLEQSRVFVK
ncbi:hypothetical protein THIAE_08170 [Thiomicrospira aerophila AL3]|uniref:Uncharacterized protein n=1 Tax=Thiomicrospira aerophila AL3 TaxID=717772 RepID=W0DT16_9GAMM|nr:DUF6746 family protein [Thiomicrospira aerophila]AHF01735.1 hypothetical protein THIAE_08170 [Thiomicrospira aerophila AL3]